MTKAQILSVENVEAAENTQTEDGFGHGSDTVSWHTIQPVSSPLATSLSQ